MLTRICIWGETLASIAKEIHLPWNVPLLVTDPDSRRAGSTPRTRSFRCYSPHGYMGPWSITHGVNDRCGTAGDEAKVEAALSRRQVANAPSARNMESEHLYGLAEYIHEGIMASALRLHFAKLAPNLPIISNPFY